MWFSFLDRISFLSQLLCTAIKLTFSLLLPILYICVLLTCVCRFCDDTPKSWKNCYFGTVMHSLTLVHALFISYVVCFNVLRQDSKQGYYYSLYSYSHNAWSMHSSMLSSTDVNKLSIFLPTITVKFSHCSFCLSFSPLKFLHHCIFLHLLPSFYFGLSVNFVVR